MLVPAWLGISELLIDENKKHEALSILQFIKTITPYSNDVHWDISLLLLKINENELAIETLINVAENNYWKRDDVFRIFDKLQIDKKIIIDNLKDGILISDYLDHLLSNGFLNESNYLWDLMANSRIDIDEKIKTRYIEFLIRKIC